MTAEDYANIQRMIDASIHHAAGGYDGELALMTDLEDLERDIQRDYEDAIVSAASELRNDLNRLERTIESLEG